MARMSAIHATWRNRMPPWMYRLDTEMAARITRMSVVAQASCQPRMVPSMVRDSQMLAPITSPMPSHSWVRLSTGRKPIEMAPEKVSTRKEVRATRGSTTYTNGRKMMKQNRIRMSRWLNVPIAGRSSLTRRR